ncbi:hypothetical protein NDU88_003373 [Pleurodeles waltl]|uniref:Uncharacterized protein n=1 Tax=Pleurodeles waltl TaxID=8319 RepID=A0AAV7P9C3_PLEWA|nr:hypothetical protein NDU88_003373 [Pleurodeles waltl]
MVTSSPSAHCTASMMATNYAACAENEKAGCLRYLHETAKDPGLHSWDISHVPSPAGRLPFSASSGLTQVQVSTPPEPRLWLQLERSRPPSLALVREEPISALVPAQEEQMTKPPAQRGKLLEPTFRLTQALVSTSPEPILRLQLRRSCPPTISDSSPERVFHEELPTFGLTQTRVSMSPDISLAATFGSACFL